MTSTNFSVSDSQKTADFALPYEFKEKEKLLKEMPFRNIDAVGPAGSINSNLNDMAKWVILNLQQGTYEGNQIISTSAMEEIQGPQVVVRGGIFSQLLSFPEMPYLMYFHYDMFRTTDDPLKGIKFTFLTNLRGDIDRVAIPLEEGVAEIVFARVPPASMRDTKFLQQFAGEYEMLGLTISVALRGDELTVTVPGQPTFLLKPYLGTEFDLKDQQGYSIKFTMDQGKATEAVFIQPNGVFTAKRK